MKDVGGMVHAILKGTIKVGECFCTAGKTKIFAQIVAALGAIVTAIAHDARLDSNSLTEDEIRDARTKCGHDTGGLMTEN
jgi:hypothetical protein